MRISLPLTISLLLAATTPALAQRATIPLDGSGGFRVREIHDLTANTGYGLVAAIGDVNDDGYGDFAIGTPTYDSSAGRVWVVLGRADFFADETPLVTPEIALTFSGGSGYGTGHAIAGGDFNGDGVDDLAIGSPNTGSGAGSVQVVFGGANFTGLKLDTDLDGSNGVDLVATGGTTGRSIAFADVNDDGIDDIVIGAPTATNNRGLFWVAFGRTDWSGRHPFALLQMTTADGYRVLSNAAQDGLGASVSGVGDFDGDGIEDFVVGAPNKAIAGLGNVGAAYVVFGTASPTSTAALGIADLTTASTPRALRFQGITDFAEFGFQVAGTGDLDRDGRPDVISTVRAQGTEGTAYVLFGRTAPPASVSAGTLNGSDGFELRGTGRAHTTSPSPIGVGGDFDGDGGVDVAIGTSSRSSNAGGVDVLHGGVAAGHVFPALIDLSQGSAAASRALPAFASSATGSSTALVDVDGDGALDMIVAATGTPSGGSSGGGMGFVVRGKRGQLFCDGFEQTGSCR